MEICEKKVDLRISSKFFVLAQNEASLRIIRLRQDVLLLLFILTFLPCYSFLLRGKRNESKKTLSRLNSYAAYFIAVLTRLKVALILEAVVSLPASNKTFYWDGVASLPLIRDRFFA